jgi:predicted pyridoxine 5'-phosphate oxidase superfamily flavin-nucleotide-binding protein
MAILTDDMKRVVREQRLGFYATVCPDGTPNVSPKGTTAVLDDDHLVFCDIRSPQTIRNLKANPAIELNVVDQFVRKGYRFKGTAEVLTEGERFDEILESYRRGNHPDLSRDRVRAIVVIHVTKALPITSPAYDWGETEESLRAIYRKRFLELNS